jgi:hypothetical protein
MTVMNRVDATALHGVIIGVVGLVALCREAGMQQYRARVCGYCLPRSVKDRSARRRFVKRDFAVVGHCCKARGILPTMLDTREKCSRHSVKREHSVREPMDSSDAAHLDSNPDDECCREKHDSENVVSTIAIFETFARCNFEKHC